MAKETTLDLKNLRIFEKFKLEKLRVWTVPIIVIQRR